MSQRNTLNSLNENNPRDTLISLAQHNQLINNGVSFYGYSSLTKLPTNLPLPNFQITTPSGDVVSRINLYVLSNKLFTIEGQDRYIVGLTIASCSSQDIWAILNLASTIFVKIEEYIQAPLAKSTLKRIAGLDSKPYTLATLANIIEGTQTQLATQLGISQRQVSGIKRGAGIHPQTLCNFKDAYPLLAYNRLNNVVSP